VTWSEGNLVKGHNLALLTELSADPFGHSQYYHCSNWRMGFLYGPFATIEAAARHVVDLEGKPLMSWSVWDKDLKKFIDYKFVGGKYVGVRGEYLEEVGFSR